MEVLSNIPMQAASRLRLDEQSKQWICKVFAAVHQVEWPRARDVEDAGSESRLRTLVTYCYARGLCRSMDIELAAEDDPAVRYLRENCPPDAGEIRRFRRRNAETLKVVLGILISPDLAEQQLLRAIQADSADLDD